MRRLSIGLIFMMRLLFAIPVVGIPIWLMTPQYVAREFPRWVWTLFFILHLSLIGVGLAVSFIQG